MEKGGKNGATTGFDGNGDTEITIYLNQPGVKFNTVKDLERIYIKEYLNFYRSANQAFTFCSRTGYSKNNSAHYNTNAWNNPTPRKYGLDEPPVGTDTENWFKAQQEQGFTPGNKGLGVLSSQRLWFDKTSPNFGEVTNPVIAEILCVG